MGQPQPAALATEPPADSAALETGPPADSAVLKTGDNRDLVLEDAAREDVQGLASAGNEETAAEANDDAKSTSSVETLRTTQRPKRPINSGVRYYNYQGFVNRVIDDSWDYTIEALVAKPNWTEDVRDELARRDIIVRPDSLEVPGRTIGPQMSSSSEKLGDSKKIHRVRIRSPTIVGVLSKLGEWAGDLSEAPEKEIVFCRPFFTMQFFHEDMKKELEEMEAAKSVELSKALEAPVVVENAPASETPAPVDSHSDGNVQPDTPTGAVVTEGTQTDSAVADRAPEAEEIEEAEPPHPTPLEDMRVYVDFVENVIMPLWRRFDRVDRSVPLKITYEEIPFLFKPGELAYVPPAPTTSKTLQRSALQTVFKMVYCIPRDIAHEFDEGNWRQHSQNTFWMLYCLDYDGDRFKIQYVKSEFSTFDNEKEITSLPCYPLKFHPHYEALLKHHTEMGARFRECVEGGVRHLYYSGWTLVTGIFPETGDENKSKPEDPEHITSEVVVDFKEASRHIPEWPPNEEAIWQGSWKDETDSACQMTYWSKDGVNQQIYVGADIILIREDNAHCKFAKALFVDDRWVHDRPSGPDEEWKPIDLAIIPRRVVGYVLRERKFARLDVQNFQVKQEDRQVTLDDIKMKPSHRNIIRSTVASHFSKKENEKMSDVPVYNPDIIQGKGRGLVILLHGAPGVGKTATAETVALENHKPLFPITCGDLGVKPESVESTLKDIFRYAHLWDCILLLDEADVFLTQRDRTDIERNALVSVFLRVLEYYSGILFLTTNRVGALDEAFRSRVHISLYYPHLSRQDTTDILKDNLDRLPRVEKVTEGQHPGPAHIQVMDKEIHDFIDREYEAYARVHKRGPWNGRQIRNAVQIASCLAFYERQSHPQVRNLPAVLTAKHFETVAETTAEFDRYLKQARRADEAKLAHMQGDRYDDYDEQNVGSSDPVQFEPRFTGRRDRGGDGRGQIARRSMEPRLSSRLPERNARSNTPQYLSPRAHPADYGRGQGRSSEPRQQNYRPRTPDDGEFESEDGDEMDIPHGGSGRDLRRGRGGQAGLSAYRSKTSPQQGLANYDDDDDVHGRLDDDEDHRDWDGRQRGSEVPRSMGRGTPSKGRPISWEVEDRSAAPGGGKDRSHAQESTPARERRPDALLDRDDYVPTSQGKSRRY